MATQTLIAAFYEYPGGPAQDVTSLTITVTPLLGGAPVLGPTSAGIAHPSTGVYVYQLDVSALDLGDYLVVWDAVEGEASEVFTMAAADATPTLDREPWYVTREDVQGALDVASTRRSAARIDQCIAAASRDVDGLTRRVFYPWTGTRYFDWPSRSGTSYRVWLDASELVSASAVTSGGEPVTDYLLEPVNSGPPYNRIEVNRGGSGSFTSGDTEQRAIAIEGVWAGCPLREDPAGTLAALLNSTDTALTVSDGSLVGVGHILRIGTERLQVTEKTAVTTGTTLSGDLAANAGATTVAVASGPAVNPGEVILVGAERMLVTNVAGNNLVVKRAWDGTVLAVHTTGATVYAYRRCTVTRGDLGTSASAHSQGDTIRAHRPPGLAQELALAYALRALLQGSSGYSHVVGSGESQREAAGRGVQVIEADTARAYQRRGRIRSV